MTPQPLELRQRSVGPWPMNTYALVCPTTQQRKRREIAESVSLCTVSPFCFFSAKSPRSLRLCGEDKLLSTFGVL